MSDLNKIINEQRERIAELEQSQVPNGYIAVPADAWHELCQQEQRAEAAEKRLAEVERERDKLRCAVATAIDVFDDYDMDVETYAPIKHVKMKQGLRDSLNKFAIEQQFLAISTLLGEYLNQDYPHYSMMKMAKNKIQQLRQQLNGGE